MDRLTDFRDEIRQGYSAKGECIILGGAMLDGECQSDCLISVPIAMLNRHGLIAGATGTGKTKTLQSIAEGLSEKSIPVLLMDIKGDLSGLARPGISNPKIEERHREIGIPYSPKGFPVELLTLSDERGARLRATTSEFGPVLFSKILGLNETQASVVSLIFKYCDDQGLPLLDLKDFKKVIQYVTNEGKGEIQDSYGLISTTTAGAILRKVIELEQQGAEIFFGEKSFEVDDLLRIDENGYGVISILRLTDIQDRPKLFSTFMLSLLAEIYSSFPEEGDLESPKLIIFIDEAHLIFDEASQALLDQIETVMKLIRSKGVGIFFCTQTPRDIPAAVLSQLGMKVQHALRAFTAKDRKDIKLVSENYPVSRFYKTDELITSLGIGEAIITALNEKGIPTPLVATKLRAPSSRMDILNNEEIDSVILDSRLVKKYNESLDRESAYEMLSQKIDELREKEKQDELVRDQEKAGRSRSMNDKGTLETIMDSTVTRQIGRTVARELTRGVLGVFGLGGRTSSTTRRGSRRRPSWF
jgi:DNA double-strand break repair helicase HerA and related ATPase